MMSDSVERWLQTFLCAQYAVIFEAYGYRTLQSVCQLQLPNLLAMGVPRNHCEKILENVNNLRQTMFGHIHKRGGSSLHHFNKHSPSLNPAVWALKTVAMNANYRGMNPYPEEYSGYGQGGSNMQGMGYHQGSYENANMSMMNPMSGAGGGGYPVSGYDASQSHMMMAGQGQMSAHTAMYQQQTQQAYMAQQQQQQQQQYYSNSAGGNSGGQYTGQAYPMQAGGNMQNMAGNNQFYNTAGSQGHGNSASKMVPPPHHHMRNTSGQQNPQQVADNILQMASSYPSHHTSALQVQVPLKNRHAPYQIPRSPQNFYPEKGGSQQQGVGGLSQQQTMANPQAVGGQQAMSTGQMPAQASQAQAQMVQAASMGQVGAVMYSGSSPHSQMPPRSSPMMASPIAGHQTQGLSSPSAMHSPSSATVCSPVPSSPGLANMRSPCSVPMRSPAHLPSGYPGQAISSPPQKPFAATDSSTAQHCSPTSMHSPASHSSSPYTPAGMAHHVSSPPQSHVYSGPSHSPYKMDMLMDSGQGPGGQGGQVSRAQGSDPLQSLQKLVMLPETQVVDPKSVVSDGCLQNCDEGSKNSEGPAEQSWEAAGCSAGVSNISSNPPASEEPSVTSTSQLITSIECASSDSEATSQSQSTVALPCAFEGSTSRTILNTATDTLSTDATAGSVACTGSQGSQASELSKGNQAIPLLPSLQSSPCKADKGASSMTSADTQNVSSKKESNLPVPKANSDVTGATAAGSCENEEKDADRSTVPDRSFVQCNGVTSPSSKEKNNELSELIVSAACVVSEAPEVVPPGKTDNTSSDQEKSGKRSPRNTKDTTKTASKPSPPKKRQSERLAQATRVGFSAAKVTTSTCKSDFEKDSAENANHLSQTANATSSANLVNGYGEAHVNGTEHCDAAKDNLDKKNHVHAITAEKEENPIGVGLPQKATETKLVKKRNSRALAFSGRASLVAVNGSGGGLLASSHEDMESSESEAEVTGEAESLAAICGILSTSHPVSDNEEDRFASGLDLGYDSPPPCETLGDDGWKPDVEKRLSSNGVDEADGTCVEDNCDKGEDLNNKGSKNSNSTKSTPSPSTRVVTRSSTGRTPKRKVDDAYMTTAKRTRRNSGATSKPNETMSLSMECDEIDTKDSFSEVEVISSSDEASSSHKDNKAENKAVKSKNQNLEEQSCKKSPVVVLTKTAGQNSKIEREAATNDQKPGRVSPKHSRHNSTQYYCIRGEKGRFISRGEAGANFSTTTIKVDSDSDDEPLILVQRRSSREEDSSAKVDNPVPVKSELEKRLVSCETNTEEIEDFKLSFSIPTQSSSTLQGRPGVSGTTSPARSDGSTPRKRGRPRKSEQSPVQNHKNIKKAAKASKKKKKMSFSRPDSADDSFKDMKLSKTLNHLKCKKKGDNSQSAGPFSPFVRVQRKTELPCKVSVFNHPPADTKDIKSINKKKSSSASAAPTVTVQITNFSSDKTVMLPSSKTTDSPWVCALCGKRSSYRFLGDLFGPYYLESHLPASSKSEGGKKEMKLGPGSSSEGQNTHNTRRRSLGFRRTSSVDESVSIPQEVWVHEDCAMWSSGVYLVDSRLYGLEEALRATMTTVCACCKEKGAMIGCLHKGCNQNFHYMCAVDKMCFLDVENFSMLCPKHKDKKLKGATASTSKS